MPRRKKNYKTKTGGKSNTGYKTVGRRETEEVPNADLSEVLEPVPETPAVVPLENQPLADFASISEDAKEKYDAEKFDTETALETAVALLKVSFEETKTEGVEEAKATETHDGIQFNFDRREYVMTEEEKMMEAFRNGTVYIPPSTEETVDSTALEKLAAQMQDIEKEIGKTPETADDSVVIPDIGNDQLESESGESDVDSDTESVHGEFSAEDFQTDVGSLEHDSDTPAVDLVANSREYARELDRLNDETLPVPERLTALGELKTRDRQESGETPLFTEWLSNFYRGSDIAANRELAMEIIKARPEWLSFDELMIIAGFLYSGTRARYENMAEWKLLVGMYKQLRRGLPQTIPGMHHITITRWLLEHPKLFQQGRLCFRDLLSREDIAPDTVYRLVLYSDISDSHREELHKTHFTHRDVPIRYKILSAQNLPSKTTGKLLESVMKDPEVEVRVRADIVDLIINHGTVIQKNSAMEVLEELGADAFNVYNNRENVHNHRVTESAVAIVDALYERMLDDTPEEIFKESLSAIDTISTLKTRWETADDFSTFKLALLRIELDRQRYGTHELTLVQILNLVLRFINSEFSADHELHTRVYQELVDSALEGETCSSGHAFRLVNALGGYTEYSVQVGFDDQLSAYFQREFRRLLEASDHMDMLMEMAETSATFLQKPETVAFMRDNLHTIRENLWQDFREDMTDLEFDETFQRVAIKYGVVV